MATGAGDPRLLLGLIPGWRQRLEDKSDKSDPLSRMVLCSHELEFYKGAKAGVGGRSKALELKRAEYLERLAADVTKAEKRARSTLRTRMAKVMKLSQSLFAGGAGGRKPDSPSESLTQGATAGLVSSPKAGSLSAGYHALASRLASVPLPANLGEGYVDPGLTSTTAQTPGTASLTSTVRRVGKSSGSARLGVMATTSASAASADVFELTAATRAALKSHKSSGALMAELRELDRRRAAHLRRLNARGIFSPAVNALRARARHRVELRDKLRVRNADPRRVDPPPVHHPPPPVREESLESRLLWLLEYMGDYDGFDTLDDGAQVEHLAAATAPLPYAVGRGRGGGASGAVVSPPPHGTPYTLSPTAEESLRQGAIAAAGAAVLAYRVRIDTLRSQRSAAAAAAEDDDDDASVRPLGTYARLAGLADAAIVSASAAESHLATLVAMGSPLLAPTLGATIAHGSGRSGMGGVTPRLMVTMESADECGWSAAAAAATRAVVPHLPSMPPPTAAVDGPVVPVLMHARSHRPPATMTAAEVASDSGRHKNATHHRGGGMGAPAVVSGRSRSSSLAAEVTPRPIEALPMTGSDATESAAAYITTPVVTFPILDTAAALLDGPGGDDGGWGGDGDGVSALVDIADDEWSTAAMGPAPRLPDLLPDVGTPPAVMLMRRLERVWALLRVPAPHQLAQVVKYTSPERSADLEPALAAWETAAAAVIEREAALTDLEMLDAALAAPHRGGDDELVAARENAAQSGALLREAERLTLHVLRADAYLHARFGDALTYHGRGYVTGEAGGGDADPEWPPTDDAGAYSYYPQANYGAGAAGGALVPVAEEDSGFYLN